MSRFDPNGLRTRVRPGDPEADSLPVVHRLALLYLALPLGIWLLGWFKWWVGLPATGLLVLALGPALRGSWRGWPSPATWGVALGALGWIMLSAIGGVFDGFNLNWLEHRATLLDLGRYPWPAFLPDELAAYVAADENPPSPLLRYYLGWYMVPGLAARWWGPGALQWAVPLWSWLGVSLILLLLTRNRRGWHAGLGVAIFVFFSGLGVLLETLGERVADFVVPMRGLENPQHFMPAGLYALLMAQLRRHPRFLAVSGVALAAAPFWSAFVAVGLLPLIAALWWTNGLRPFLRWPNLCLAVPLAGLTILYLTAGTLDFPRGWLWELHGWPLLARQLPLIYLGEFGLLAFLLQRVRPQLRRDPFFVASLLTLLLLPLYHFGQAGDLRANGSRPAIVLLIWFCVETLPVQGLRSAWKRPRARRYAALGLALVWALGAVTAAQELARNLRDVYPFRYAAHAQHTTLVDLPVAWQRQNAAPALPALLGALLREAGNREANFRRGELILRGVWDLYWADNRLVYVKAPCVPADLEDLYVQAVPADRARHADAFRRLRMDSFGYRYLLHQGRHMGNACGLIWPAPSFALKAVRTGQRMRAEANWEAELTLDAAGAVKAVTYQDSRAFRAAYAAVTAGAPAARAVFDVYLDTGTVTFAKDVCTRADLMPPWFWLEAHPVRRARADAALQTIDFRRAGVRIDGHCYAAMPLPTYDFVQLRVGQHGASRGDEAWTVALNPPAVIRAYRDQYQALAAAAPALRAVFDVYVTENAVLFLKEPCAPEDTQPKFILHVLPARRGDLSPRRRRLGFDNLGFAFDRYGVHMDGQCLARVELPDYAIARLRVGQFLSREGRDLWKEEIPLTRTP